MAGVLADIVVSGKDRFAFWLASVTLQSELSPALNMTWEVS